MVRNDNVRSTSGMPDQPADADHVEPGILCLVEALNRVGFRTRASCQGHWHWFFGASDPYVAFTGDIGQASRLSHWLYRHWQQGGLYWELTARFGTDGLLWYRLSPPFRCRNGISWLPPLFWRHCWISFLGQVENDQVAISALLSS